MSVVIEACVESLEAALAAERGGADRLELCANLDVGGTTPDRALVAEVKSSVAIPVFVMIRPRAGSFVYTSAERDAMRCEIESARRLGADGFVLGLLDELRRIDVNGAREVLGDAHGLPVTFHKAFDEIHDQLAALDALVELGVQRVLTSGGATSALAGAEAIKHLVARAGGRITIMAGGSVRAHNAREVVERSGVRELHARCEHDPARIATILAAVGSRSVR